MEAKGNGFVRGASRALDLCAKNKRMLSTTIRYSDRDAIAKDWENVGKSIRKATEAYDPR